MLDDMFFQHLDISPEERRVIDTLGVSDAAGLFSMIETSQRLFEERFGSARTRKLLQRLWELVTPEQRAVLKQPAPPAKPMGAIIDRPAPPLQGG